MKCIRALDEPTAGLLDYLDCEGERADWDGFRSHQAGAAYREIADTLQNVQHGLCGYCEIDVRERDRQIEHVVPRSDPEQGMARALDPTNLMVCCKGGTSEIDDDARWRTPVRRNLSCGQAKEDSVDPNFVDPRTLPALPSLTLVRFNGEIKADEVACANADIDADRINRTIEVLGLNVERLRLAREKHWNALSDNWQGYLDDPRVMREAAREKLSPGKESRLPRFFTTNRSYFAPVSEEILAEAPRAWI